MRRKTIGFPCSVCKFDANIIQNAVVDIETVMKWCTTSVDPVKCASTFNFRKKKYPRIFSRHRKKQNVLWRVKKLGMPEVETKKCCVNKGSYVTEKLKSIFFIPNLLKSHGFMATPCPWVKYITFTSYYMHYVYFDNFWVQFPTKAPDGYAPPKLRAVLFLLSAQSIPPPGET